MNRKAQALLELALFLGLMLMVLLAALNYQRNMREQKFADNNVFDQTVKRADKEIFPETDIDGETWTCTGAIVSYSLNVDRQANRIFQGGQRRTVGSSASVYYSGAEDPKSYEFNYYNNTDISKGDLPVKIYTPRNYGTADPEDAMKLSTADYIAIAYPIVSGLAQWMFNLKEHTWFKEWGGPLDTVIRLASYIYFTVRYNNALQKMDTAEAERLKLEALDKKMGEWGWRICDEVHDGKARAGKEYVKNVTPQVYDTEIVEDKSIDYDETQQVSTGTRNVTVGDKVTYEVFRRYDKSIDPTIPPDSPDRILEKLPSKEVTVDLGGGQNETWNWK